MFFGRCSFETQRSAPSKWSIDISFPHILATAMPALLFLCLCPMSQDIRHCQDSLYIQMSGVISLHTKWMTKITVHWNDLPSADRKRDKRHVKHFKEEEKWKIREIQNSLILHTHYVHQIANNSDFSVQKWSFSGTQPCSFIYILSIISFTL